MNREYKIYICRKKERNGYGIRRIIKSQEENRKKRTREVEITKFFRFRISSLVRFLLYYYSCCYHLPLVCCMVVGFGVYVMPE